MIHNPLITSSLAPEQEPPQNLDQNPAQKIWQMMHDCIYVGPKGSYFTKETVSYGKHITLENFINSQNYITSQEE